MDRRDLLRLCGPALLWASLPVMPRLPFVFAPSSSSRRLFFDPEDMACIRRNARSPLLRPVFERWAALPPSALREAVEKGATGNLIYDFRDALEALTRASVAQLGDPTEAREAALLDSVRTVVAMPKWDYFLDGGTEIIGIMRASMATTRLLFTREVLGDAVDPALDAALLDAVAEKGCEPCYRTVYGMDHPETVRGWGFDEDHQWVYSLSMRRWPEILGANNLRAIPTHGLGLGALALEGRDERAALWLDTAERSSRRFLSLLSPDGSYFEGLSYIDYALQTLLSFLNAHQRLRGTVDWKKEANFEGVVDFILAMQAGRREDGTPDIVNFSDARKSVSPGIPGWIARETGSAVAQFAAEHVSEPGAYVDFLWYDPERPAAPPPESLKNKRLDLDWIICRTGWEADAAVLAFRSGNPANHEHADRNSFLFKIHGERLLTDHEGADYDVRNPGWLLRLTEAHNAVLIDGQGHQYHRGEEGTNEGQAKAHVVRFEDEGERVWWSSDATHGYKLVHPDVTSVVRTVAFAKPGVIVLLDTVTLQHRSARVDLRFFPDNRDGAARLEVEDGKFLLGRPRARLHGFSFGREGLALASHRLSLPPELGVFPFVEVTSGTGMAHEIVTVLVAQPSDTTEAPVASVSTDETGWRFEVGGVQGRFNTTGSTPVVRWA